MSVHESGEMYLEAILVLGNKSGYVRSIDVGEYLGYSKPSVSRAMGILRKGGFVTVEKDGALQLTQTGREIAEKNIRAPYGTIKGPDWPGGTGGNRCRGCLQDRA